MSERNATPAPLTAVEVEAAESFADVVRRGHAELLLEVGRERAEKDEPGRIFFDDYLEPLVQQLLFGS